tara:strand:+ start:1375 stop:1854 length:480 start_codon:yes stop_codon:yes gene_type:complete
MSEESDERMQTYVTYDYGKIIKGIECSTVYIHALQNIVTKMITKNEDRVMTVAETFGKFTKISESNKAFEAALAEGQTQEEAMKLVDQSFKLNEYESDLYTLYSLLQQMKIRAQDQGFEIETETTATKAEVKELTEAMAAGQDVTERMKDLQSKLSIVK